jgi:hypothetical protein
VSITKRRNRIVVFRLTQDEYKRLQKACSSTGASSISDFTRRELLDKPDTGQPEDLENRLSAFQKQLSDLQSTLRQINSLLKRIADSNGQ